tara:strand:- start:98 stop:559 length:462 start_codon:yes stop_codon:yes gene_type:complete
VGKTLNILLCSLVVLGSSEAHSQSLIIDSGWIRLLPSSIENTAAYMKITNSGDEAIEISNVQSLIAQRAELHRSYYKNGLMQMRHLESLTIPAQSSIAMTSNGIHIMLIGLKQSLEHGQLYEVCLISTLEERMCSKLEVLNPSDQSNFISHEH